MKSQPKLAFKLKTLTASLAIVTGFGIANTFAYTATSEEGKSIQAMSSGLDVWLDNYKATGTYNLAATSAQANDYVAMDTGIDLTNVEMKKLYDAQKTFEPSKTELEKAYDNTKLAGNIKLTALHSVLGDIEDFDDDDTSNAPALDLLKAVNNDVDIIDTTEFSENYSSLTTASAGIDALNKSIDAVHKEFATATGKISVADIKAARHALLNYMAAYVDAGAVDVAEIDKTYISSMTTGVAKLIAEAITAAKEKVNNNGKDLVKITTDTQLDAAIALSDADLTKAVAAVKAITHGNSVNFTKSNAALVKHYEAANKLSGDAKIKATEEASAKLLPSPRSLGNASAVQSTKAVMQNIAQRTDMLMAGVNSGDEDIFGDGSVWLRATFVSSDTDAKEGSPAYKQKSTGFGIGVDQQLNEKFDFGLSYNFVKSDVDGKDGFLQEDDVKTHAFGAYLSMMHDNMFADAQINYLKNKVDGKRGIGADDAIAYETYKFDGDVVNAAFGVGMKVDLDNDWYAKPKVCFAFANYKNDKRNETGSFLAVTDIDEANYSTVELGLQFVVGADMMMENCKFQPNMKLGFMYDLNDSGNKVKFKFLDKDISVEGPKRDRSNFNVGLGAGFVMDEVTISLDYGFNWSSNTKAHAVMAKVGYMF